MQPRILMLVTNPVDPDPRVEREARSLVSHGFTVRIVGMAAAGSKGDSENVREGLSILRLDGRSILFSARTGRWIGALFRLLKFNLVCLRHHRTIVSNVVVVHSHDLDTLPIGFLLSLISGAKLVYDAHELYTGMFAETVPKPIKRFVDAIELALAPRADLVVTTGDLMALRMKRISGKEPLKLRNAPSSDFSTGIQHVEPEAFTVGYVGGFLEDRNLIELVSAFRSFHQKRSKSILVLAGWGPLSDKLAELASQSEGSIQFLGKIPKDEVPQVFARLSIAIVFTTKSKLNHVFASANKVFEAAAVGVPVLATGIGELGHIVTKYRLGYVVDSDDVSAIEEILLTLYNRRTELPSIGEGARRTFRDRFAWEYAEESLVKSYEKLVIHKLSRGDDAHR